MSAETILDNEHVEVRRYSGDEDDWRDAPCKRDGGRHDGPFYWISRNWANIDEADTACVVIRADDAVEVAHAILNAEGHEPTVPDEDARGPATLDVVRVEIKERTDEERGMILIGLRMVKGVLEVEADESDPKVFHMRVDEFTPTVGSALIVIEGVIKVSLVRREPWVPF